MLGVCAQKYKKVRKNMHFVLANFNVRIQKSIVIQNRVDCISFLQKIAFFPFKTTVLWHIWLINLCEMDPSDDCCVCLRRIVA